MNYLRHRQQCPGHVLSMPEGLQQLLTDISREVLRCQPSADCIYKFIADYLQDMVETRDKCAIAMEIIDEAILKTDEVYSQFVKCNIPKDKTNSFLDLMEITFRRFVDQKRRRNHDPRYIRFHADDMLEELVRKCDLTKVEILRSRPVIQWAYKKFVKTYLEAVDGSLDTEDLYFNTEKVVASKRELDELNRKIILIQKTYRGYITRKHLKQRPSHSPRSTEEILLLENDERTNPSKESLWSKAESRFLQHYSQLESSGVPRIVTPETSSNENEIIGPEINDTIPQHDQEEEDNRSTSMKSRDWPLNISPTSQVESVLQQQGPLEIHVSVTQDDISQSQKQYPDKFTQEETTEIPKEETKEIPQEETTEISQESPEIQVEAVSNQEAPLIAEESLEIPVEAVPNQEAPLIAEEQAPEEPQQPEEQAPEEPQQPEEQAPEEPQQPEEQAPEEPQQPEEQAPEEPQQPEA